MTPSGSPTHPDAPRAGGETPDIDLEATLSVLRIVEYDLRHRDEAPEPNATSNEIHAEFAQTLATLRSALPSLLERHRDGEWTCHAERNCGPHDAGCGKSIAAGEEYRCLDCDAVMHKDCLRAHCSADEKDATILRLQLTIQSRDDILERICAEMPDASAGPSPERALSASPKRLGDIPFARLIRDCPTPHVGGTCGCGCGCTSPREADEQDEMLRLQWAVSECRDRLRGAHANLEAFMLDQRRGAHP